MTSQAVCVLPAELSCDVVAITIADPGNPDGYLSIPLAYVGPLWQPVRNFSTDSSSGFNLGVDEVTALSGAEFPQMRWIQRKASIAHQSYGAAETAILREIQRVAAVGENILFLPDPGAASQEEAIFGRLSGGDIGNPCTLPRSRVIGNTQNTTDLLRFSGGVQVYNEIPAEFLVQLDEDGAVSLKSLSVLSELLVPQVSDWNSNQAVRAVDAKNQFVKQGWGFANFGGNQVYVGLRTDGSGVGLGVDQTDVGNIAFQS